MKRATKYYDAMNRVYDPVTHCEIENFDITQEFSADQYARVFFRIDCPVYDFRSGFSAENVRSAFYDEMKDVLRHFGIVESCGFISGREMSEIEHLHIHPQELSGVVAKNKIKAIAEMLCDCHYAFCRSVDVYDDIFPISNDDFLRMLPEKHDQIVSDILTAFQTKRKNLFFGEYATSCLLEKIGNRYTIRRRQCESGTDYQAKKYVSDVLLELVEAKKIVSADTAKDGIGYRTAKKGDFAV